MVLRLSDSSKYEQNPFQITRQHMVAQSRCRTEEERVDPENIKIVMWMYHEAWHVIFSNRTPFEAIVYIIEEVAPLGYFVGVNLRTNWRSFQESYSLKEGRKKEKKRELSSKAKGAWELLFGRKNYFQVVSHIINEWSPKSYYEFVHVKTRAKASGKSYELLMRRSHRRRG